MRASRPGCWPSTDGGGRTPISTESWPPPVRRPSRWRCPVELVWGDDDTAAPLAVAQAAADRLGRGPAPASTPAHLTVLPGAGHLTPLTAPDALAAAVQRVRP